MAKTKYAGVYNDSKGQFYYETDLGIDRITGKRLRKKGVKINKVRNLSQRHKHIKSLFV